MMKELNKHDYSGMCDPGDGKNIRFETFSVGIFQWVAKSGTDGLNPISLKKSNVKVRIYGIVKEPEKVREKALEICAQLDVGTYQGGNCIRV